jgi:hypothetical protein
MGHIKLMSGRSERYTQGKYSYGEKYNFGRRFTYSEFSRKRFVHQ